MHMQHVHMHAPSYRRRRPRRRLAGARGERRPNPPLDRGRVRASCLSPHYANYGLCLPRGHAWPHSHTAGVSPRCWLPSPSTRCATPRDAHTPLDLLPAARHPSRPGANPEPCLGVFGDRHGGAQLGGARRRERADHSGAKPHAPVVTRAPPLSPLSCWLCVGAGGAAQREEGDPQRSATRPHRRLRGMAVGARVMPARRGCAVSLWIDR